MAGNTITAGDNTDYMIFSVPGYTSAEYTNAAAGVHDDMPYFKWSDILPAQQESDLWESSLSAPPPGVRLL